MSDENKPQVGAYVRDQDANAAISDIPKNRTMMVAKLTADPAIRPEVVDGLTNPEEVFAHFRPEKEVGFENEEGAEVKETLRFGNLGHFGPKGITGQSSFLQDLDGQVENYNKFLKQLKSNKILQSLLADPDAKEAYIQALQTILQELEDVDEEEN